MRWGEMSSSWYQFAVTIDAYPAASGSFLPNVYNKSCFRVSPYNDFLARRSKNTEFCCFPQTTTWRQAAAGDIYTSHFCWPFFQISPPPKLLIIASLGKGFWRQS